MTTYEFFNIETGDHLATLATNDPDSVAFELAIDNHIHPEDVAHELAENE